MVIYFFKDIGPGMIKIGTCNKDELDKEFKVFESYCANQAELIGFIESSDSTCLVEKLHNRFELHKLVNDFYSISSEQAKQFIEDHSTEKDNEIRNRIASMLSNDKFSVEMIEDALKVVEQNLELSPNRHNRLITILSFVEEWFKGESVSAKKIQEEMLNRWDPGDIPGFKELGLALKTRWTKGSFRHEGKTTHKYYID